MKRVGKNSILFDNVYVLETATSTGPREKKGPIGEYIDKNYDNLNCLEKSWEKAECRLQKDVIEISLKKAALEEKDLDLIVSGDLNNQIVVSSFTAKDYDIPHIGIYGACTTSILSLIVGSNYIDTKTFNNVLCLTSSHYATSEKQFRFPIEYGAPKPHTTTFTSTGCVGVILTNEKNNIKIESATVGIPIDMGITDAFHMGAVMAPAAATTLERHLLEMKRSSDYYDLVLTGDLGAVGTKIFREFLRINYDIKLKKHIDAGSELYSKNQETYAGASGPVALPLVLFNQILKSKKYKRILLIGTGSLHTVALVNQKKSIPAIAHAVSLEVV